MKKRRAALTASTKALCVLCVFAALMTVFCACSAPKPIVTGSYKSHIIYKLDTIDTFPDSGLEGRKTKTIEFNGTTYKCYYSATLVSEIYPEAEAFIAVDEDWNDRGQFRCDRKTGKLLEFIPLLTNKLWNFDEEKYRKFDENAETIAAAIISLDEYEVKKDRVSYTLYDDAGVPTTYQRYYVTYYKKVGKYETSDRISVLFAVEGLISVDMHGLGSIDRLNDIPEIDEERLEASVHGVVDGWRDYTIVEQYLSITTDGALVMVTSFFGGEFHKLKHIITEL